MSDLETIIAANLYYMPGLIGVLIRDAADLPAYRRLLPIYQLLHRFDIPLAFFVPRELIGRSDLRLPFHRSSYYYRSVEQFGAMLEVCRLHHDVEPEKAVLLDLARDACVPPGEYGANQPWLCGPEQFIAAFTAACQRRAVPTGRAKKEIEY